ncbi:MAG: Hachiman antiphage defense system protein HamA [Candidatus Nanopelagicales bacterium]
MTDFFSPWCDPPKDEVVGKHTSRVLVSSDDGTGIDAVVAILPSSYAEKENLRRIAERHGKKGVATLLGNKVPKSQRGRSGDMGEILGTAYVQSTMGYETGPSRLIERDHQEWAMRGDDILGARLNGQKLELVKVEAKSRAKARTAVITEAREGLRRNDDLASAHSLTQFAERLLQSNELLSDAVNDVLQNDGLRPGQLAHVMFIFAGNHPAPAVRDDLKAYKGRVTQTTVTVHVKAHQDFIRKSYGAAVTHAP